MQILQGSNFRALFQKRMNPARRGMRGRQRRDARDVVANGCPSNRFFVVERFASQRRVDDEIDLSSFHQIHDVRPALIHFEDGFRFDAGGFQRRGGSARRKQPKT